MCFNYFLTVLVRLLLSGNAVTYSDGDLALTENSGECVVFCLSVKKEFAEANVLNKFCSANGKGEYAFAIGFAPIDVFCTAVCKSNNGSFAFAVIVLPVGVGERESKCGGNAAFFYFFGSYAVGGKGDNDFTGCNEGGNVGRACLGVNGEREAGGVYLVGTVRSGVSNVGKVHGHVNCFVCYVSVLGVGPGCVHAANGEQCAKCDQKAEFSHSFFSF